MKKVILFIDNLGSGGAQRQIANVAVLLKKAGYDVSVLVYQDFPFYKPLLDDNNVPVVLVETKNNLKDCMLYMKLCLPCFCLWFQSLQLF